MLVALASDIRLHVPDGCAFSVFNSPYPMHRGCGALDVYSEEALMPAEEGRVLEVRWFRGPKKRGCDPREPVILISLARGLILKVMHVEPHVEPGERLSLFDPIGRVLRSCYLCPWSDPHAHFEVKVSKPYRAGGWVSLDLSPLISAMPDPPRPRASFIVHEVRREYIWLRPKAPQWAGLAAIVRDRLAYVDGGIPHYGYGAALGAGMGRVSWVDGSVIGEPAALGDFGLLFHATSKPAASGVECRGVGSYLGEGRLKLIVRREEHGWSEGDELELTFQRSIQR